MRKKTEWMELRTDLALEAKESFPGDGGEIRGVELKEHAWKDGRLRLTEVVIKTDEGARCMGKPLGHYVTLEAPELTDQEEAFYQDVTEELARQIRNLLALHQAEHLPVLVVGLGNPAATPDALGPKVLEHLQVTRHLSREFGEDFCEKRGYPILSGMTPGVMARTGMETAEMIRGVVRETRPGAVLVIDALAAQSIHRLGTTIQLSDAGIHPGSGVGNHRSSLTKESLGVPVLAVGIPTVVGAAAIVYDTMEAMITVLKQAEKTKDHGRYLENLAREEQYELIREILEPEFGPMYVTPHNIDERVDVLGRLVSEAIHLAFFKDSAVLE